MGRRAIPVSYVCRACGAKRSTRRTGQVPIYCNRQCRADYERKGEAEPTRYIQNGYWMLRWTIPGGTKYRPNRVFIFEHRYVWEQANGPVPDGYVVHHINGDRRDNQLENLLLMRRGDHGRLHCRDYEKYPEEPTSADYTRRWKERHPEYKAVHARRERECRRKKRAMA